MTTERTEKRVNRFNGESIMLTKEEAKIELDEVKIIYISKKMFIQLD